MRFTSSQASCLTAWFQSFNADAVGRDNFDILYAFAARLDEARWLACWLREEVRLSTDADHAARLAAAVRNAMQRLGTCDDPAQALQLLLTQLDSYMSGQLPQLAGPDSTLATGVGSAP